MCTTVLIDYLQASEAIRSAVRHGKIHCLVEGGGVIIELDRSLEAALDDVLSATYIAFMSAPFKHDLALLIAGRIFRYDVPHPGE